MGRRPEQWHCPGTAKEGRRKGWSLPGAKGKGEINKHNTDSHTNWEEELIRKVGMSSRGCACGILGSWN